MSKESVSSRIDESILKKIADIAKKNKWTISFTIERLLEQSVSGVKK